ncbi:malic enzyme-like NAD(P)-binding protein, partial [Acetobacter fabarum]
DEATRRIWLVDLPGLLTDDMQHGLLDFQISYARPSSEVQSWTRVSVDTLAATETRWPAMAALRRERAQSDGTIELAEVVKNVRPTILIGTS